MALPNPFKHEKLKIEAYEDKKRSKSIETFEAMFNPTSLNMCYGNKFLHGEVPDNGEPIAIYSYTESQDLNLKLILDGTGVTDFGVETLFGKGHGSVTKQVEKFLKLCFYVKDKTHEPNYLKIKWGLLDYRCRLSNVNITYTLFDKSGMPLRAELDTTFISDDDGEAIQRKLNFSSPDRQHMRVVKSGDTLPLLAKEIYGDAAHYLRVAQVNNLDNFRNLTPGHELFFPPLAN